MTKINYLHNTKEEIISDSHADTIRKAMAIIGARRSKKKAMASRRNGMLGGRPPVKAKK